MMTNKTERNPDAPVPASIEDVNLPDPDSEVVHYGGVHVFRAREMSRRDWSNFGVPSEVEVPPVIRWGPENGWNVPASTLREFLTPEQFAAFVQPENGLEVRPA